MGDVEPVPEGLHTVTAGITVRGAAEALAFYVRAFGAEELRRFAAPDGTIMHSEMRIGDSVVLVNDEIPASGLLSPQHFGGSSSALTIHTADADELFHQALSHGATESSPMQDTFTGERFGILHCPFGHRWIIAKRIQDVTTDEIQRRLEESMKAS